MAVVNPLREDNYELELSGVKDKIKTKFVELIDCLKARESELLRELDNILTSYLSYRSEFENVRNKVESLNVMKQQQEETLISSPVKPFVERILNEINTELESIETPIKPKMISFEFDSTKMLAEMNKLGYLVEKVRSGIDYKSKKQPLVSVCDRGEGIEQLYWPLGVKVDNKTGNIYIADQCNNCVKVFDSTGKYLFKFGDNEGEGKMFFPRGIAICGNIILISQYNNCILNYELNGMFVSRIGRAGKGELEFNFPYGIAIDESNREIYICDSNNNRIKILSKDLSFKSQFGKDTLKSPHDIKLSKKYIYVLDESNPCLHLFNYNYILQNSVISRGEGMDIVYSLFFFIDQTDNIIISDRSSNSVHIFNPQFNKIHTISTSTYPSGITVDKQGRIIVVTQSAKDCLQIF